MVVVFEDFLDKSTIQSIAVRKVVASRVVARYVIAGEINSSLKPEMQKIRGEEKK